MAPAFQRQGLGTQLLQTCGDRVCYDIPWQHLRSFYQQVGFQDVSPHRVPVLLREGFEGYIARGMNVVMR